MRKIMYCMILIFSLFILGGCGSDRDKQLIMVTEAGFAPYEFYENGEIVGVDVEIAREIANAMGKELVVKDVAFDFIINEVQSGKADFGAAGITVNPKREESVDFTDTYAEASQVVIVRK